jgi:protein-S-isoprenylcysteine O-methyltransferase Ste14
VPAVLTVGVILLRTYLEDKTLIDELDGYLAYTDQVRFRIIPGIW